MLPPQPCVLLQKQWESLGTRLILIDTSSSYLLGVSDGDVVGEEPNPAVPTEVLTEILHLKKEMSMEDVISRLRSRTVPPGYPYHTWRILSGKFALLN